MSVKALPPASDGRRASGSDSGRAAIDWERAFFFFATLPRERRHYQAVADEFNVSVRTVETHGARERWAERVAAIDARAAAEADALLARSRAERIAEDERLIDKSLAHYEAQLDRGEVPLTAADAARLMKARPELRTESDVPAAPLRESPEWIEVKAKIVDALADYPEARAAVADILEEQTYEE